VFDDDMKTWRSAQDIDVGDADYLFGLMDTGDEQLAAEEFCLGISRLKGPAKSMDLCGLTHMTWCVPFQLMRIQDILVKDENSLKPPVEAPLGSPGLFTSVGPRSNQLDLAL